MTSTAKKLLAPACLAVTAGGLMLWFFAPVWFGGESFAYRDAAHYYHPLFQWTAQQWGAGQVPLWNPQENCGVPVLADTTSSVLYPGKLWFALPLDFATCYVLYITSHVALAAVTAYVLARRWRASRFAAGVCGLSYAFGGVVLFQYCNVVFLVSAAWLPIALLATDAMLTRRSLRYALVLGFVLALMTFGGDPQAAYHTGLAATLYAVMLWRRGRRARRRLAGDASHGARLSIWRRLPRHRFSLLSLAAVSGFLFAAVQILPAVEWSRRSDRAVYSRPRNVYEAAEYIGRRGANREDTLPNAAQGLLGEPTAGMHHAHAYDFSLAPWRAAELLWPNISGTSFPIHRRWTSLIPAESRVWTPSIYMGLLPLLLALTAWRLRRGPTRIRWLSWLVVLFAVGSLGWYGLGWLLHEIRCGLLGASPDEPLIGMPVGGLYWWMTTLLPGYVYFRYPAKLLVFAALGMSLLAARGWDKTFGPAVRRPSNNALRWMLVVVLVLSVVLAVGVWLARGWILSQFESAPTDDLFGPIDADGALDVVLFALAQSAVVAGLSLLFWFGNRRRQLSIWQAALLVLIAVDLGLSHGWFVVSAPRRLWDSPSAMGRRIAALDPSPRSSYRVHRALPDRWVPRRWVRRSSPDRLGEGIAWDRNTMSPKHPLPAGWRMLEAHGTMTNYDYLALMNIARQYGVERSDGVLEPHPAVLDALSTRWFVAPASTRPERTQRVAPASTRPAVEDAELLQCADALPRAWLVREVEVMPPLTSDEPAVVGRRTQQVLFPDFVLRDLHRMAVVEQAESPITDRLHGLQSADSAEDACRVVVDEPLRVEVEIETEQDALLVLNDLYYPGWQAEIHSASGPALSTEILRTNRIMRGVIVPGGRHRVVFVYRPWSFYLGALLSAAAWLGVALALGVLLIRLRIARSRRNACRQ